MTDDASRHFEEATVHVSGILHGSEEFHGEGVGHGVGAAFAFAVLADLGVRHDLAVLALSVGFPAATRWFPRIRRALRAAWSRDRSRRSCDRE